MSCDQIRAILEDYIDGSASSESNANAAEHLESCESCSSEEQAIRSLKSRAAALSHSIEPGRDLWSGIDAGLGSDPRRASSGRIIDNGPRPWSPPRRASLQRQLLVAASLAAVVVGAGYVWKTMRNARMPTLAEGGGAPQRTGFEGEDPASTIAPALGFGSSSVAAPWLGGAELAFVEAKQQLRTALYEKRKSLSPETLKTVDQELKVIEDAIVVIRGAVEKDPGNRELQKMLVATRQREVALLRHMTQTADLRSR